MFGFLKKMFNKKNKFIIIGAGGTGLSLASYLKLAGEDVVTIAKEDMYNKIKKEGITFSSDLVPDKKGIAVDVNIKPLSYSEKADFIFVCTRTPDIDSTIPIIKKCSKKNTLILPLCNGFGVSEYFHKLLPDSNVLQSYCDGPFYKDILAVKQTGTFSGLYFGAANNEDAVKLYEELNLLKNILAKLPLRTELYSPQRILFEVFKKHCLISPFEIAGLYYRKTMGEILENNEASELMHNLLKELAILGEKLGIVRDENFYNEIAELYKYAAPDMRSRAENDTNANKVLEIYFQLFDIVNKGKEAGIELPVYEQMAAHFENLKQSCKS